uniref:F-box domain-containing protein n=1 Tax=Mycena chlorophos TaxID=658473 RepID=A0ABQ0KW60_MYCCL|nr:predicted protein [Mycena chlorophos]
MARLPPELEHEIFRTTAVLHRRHIPTLLLVARRVHSWSAFPASASTNTPLIIARIEPLLYQSIYLGNARQFTAIQTLIPLRPPAFWAAAVRHVHIAFSRGGFYNPTEDNQILSLCTGVERLALSSARANPGIFPILATLSIKRFGGRITHLFQAPSPPLAMDGRHSAFRALTHLEPFDAIDKRMITFLCALPELTHLATGTWLQQPEMQQLFEGCEKLRVFVYLGRFSAGGSGFIGNYADIHDRVFDPRFVICGYESWDEAAWPDGRESYWTKAERLLARKARGEAKGLWAK